MPAPSPSTEGQHSGHVRMGVPPQLVALVRGIAVAAALGAITAALHAFAGLDLSDIDPTWRPIIAGVVVVAARYLEGVADQLRGQANQAGPLGGAPANPLDYAIHADDVAAAGDFRAAHTGAALLTQRPAAAVEWLDTPQLAALGQTITGELEARHRSGFDLSAKRVADSTPPTA